MQAVSPPFGSNHFTRGHGFPTAKTDFDFVGQLNLIAGLKPFENLQSFKMFLVHVSTAEIWLS